MRINQMEGKMNTSSEAILFALLISVIASATNTDLANNTNFLLLMLLALSGNQNQCRTNCQQCCSSMPRFFV